MKLFPFSQEAVSRGLHILLMKWHIKQGPGWSPLLSWIKALHAPREAVIGEEEDGADVKKLKWILLNSTAEPSRTVERLSLCSILSPRPFPPPICKTKKQKEKRPNLKVELLRCPQGAYAGPSLLYWAMLLLHTTVAVKKQKKKEKLYHVAQEKKKSQCAILTF